MKKIVRGIASCLAAGLALSPRLAEAHLVTTGLGPVYDGISHFSLSPEEVLPVVALSLFAGLRGPGQARHALFILPSAWILGGLVALFGLSLPDVSGMIVTAALFLLVGGMLVSEAFAIGGMRPDVVRITPAAVASASTLLGLIRGDVDMTGFMISRPAAAGPNLLSLTGVAITVFVVMALAASLSLPLKAMWARMAVCVTGSWSAALGLLLVGWSIHLAIAAH